MKPIAVALALAAGLGLAPALRAETLDFSWPLNVGPLNPHLYSPSQMFAQAMVYEGLVKYRPDGTVAPALATHWTVSPDGKTVTFTLRDGVSFSDGEPFDAAAVEMNFAAVMGNGARHKWLGLMGALASVRATGPMTVEITTKEPYYPLLQELSLIRPVRFLAPDAFPDSGQSADGIKAPIGTGPWVLSESVLGEYDVFIRNESYWGPKPAFDKIMVKVIADPNTRAIALETGEIDMIYGLEGQITPDTFQRLKDAGYESGTSKPLETLALALNTGKGPTADLAVRKAINHALNKDAMVAGIFYGTQARADTLFAPTVPYADIGLVPYGYDPSAAMALLDAAGWTLPDGAKLRMKEGQPLQIDLVYEASDAVMKSVAEVAQADLAAVGIGVTLAAAEETEFYGRQQSGNFSMIFNSTWGNPYDPHAFVSSMRVPSHADYQAQLGLQEKPEIDAAIGAVLVSTDEAERQARYDYILRTLHDEAVYAPLTYATAIGVLGKDVTGLSFGATSNEIPFETLRPAR
ncbi:nickel ABC transporter, nickel/metallophore periplasmic binding protein [Rhodovulum sulfidophilum]|uniref:Nickel ABC transporter, nickel/metallophore periplasmic binding protein n=1 Tax=Rhodovulum visakhapatnamense TaxID=364297 RepID=A0ABS1RDW5_9RHOB|nr:nickel ABC transporter substrate-binding protein [Rhodovulum visakhapatnamense]MBL3569743.1 nickel ABC transporter, nickel/metallophore periplasmic binding protein [Rhodovulum visakhapatnamense]MBL3577825.1 nickel ABC transporter, nickel/metallophore periplasmic binding protein [Rhodovulum visakhapatnamense]OLS42343.1 nickel ABC transporter, nickel/metallophore periplasmic binding protein [Rhodovulum sulfidophilum]